jgi:spermidine/putrescine transport system permease protein
MRGAGAEAPAPASPMAAAEATGTPNAPSRRRRRGALSTYLLLSPGIVVLLAFFVAPLYYVFLFSTGQRYQGVTKAAAFINGELTSFSWDRWRELLGSDATLNVLGASQSMPLWVFGLIEVALLTGTLRGLRLPRYGREVMVGSLALLVAPYLTLPAGSSVARLIEIKSDNPSITLFFRSVSTSLTVSVVAVLMAFPVAYYLAFCRGKSKYTWLVIVIAPFLTSYLLRILAFKVILTDDGLVNSALFETGLRGEGHQVEWLLYTQFTVLLVLLYAWVPFVTLPIFVALENMDRRLLEAATDLGASRMRAFMKITLPIAAPGIVAAFLFVFIPTIGEFVTPALVGGSKGYLFGSAIADDFGQNSDWQTGAVLALFLMGVVLVLTGATSRFLRATGGGT